MLPLPGTCANRRHVIRTERLLCYTPETSLDIAARLAAAADPEAQRWLGAAEHEATVHLADARVREAVVNLRPGDPDSLNAAPWTRQMRAEPFEPRDEAATLIAVRRDDGRYAGSIDLRHDLQLIGGCLAPHARGTGMGTELFLAAALLAHTHFGLPTIGAGYEVTNTASARALAAAGFVPADGPPTHTLENGREIEARWVQHVAERPTSRCRGAGPTTPSKAKSGSVSDSA
ncbi:GNAT family N-acetyltransferase [Streptomyces sp. NPDC088732]|uniref:GNAT family N-acetyltransferase n=1 Tax=Streptomyces sp. NPDC088732 TaxID=3365879 RepID=UPI0038147E0D